MFSVLIKSFGGTTRRNKHWTSGRDIANMISTVGYQFKDLKEI